MQITEEQRKSLAGLCRIEIKRWKAASESNPNMRYMVEIIEIALAALTDEPADWQFKAVNGEWMGTIGRDGMLQAVKEGCEVRALYTAPPVAALRLPDEITLKDAPRLLDDDEQRCWVAGAHYMRNQVERLNASAPEENQIDYQIEYRISQVKAWVSVTKETYDKAGRNVKKRIVRVVEQNQ